MTTPMWEKLNVELQKGIDGQHFKCELGYVEELKDMIRSIV